VARLAPRPAALVATYVGVAALAAPGALLAAEEPKPSEQGKQPEQAPGQGQQESAPQPEAEAQPEDRQTPAQATAPAEPPPQPQASPAAAPQQASPAEQPAAAVAADPGSKKAKKEHGEAAPVARTAAAGSVTIKDFSFSPKSVTVNQGDSVTWTNSGPTEHSATASDGSFDTGVFKKGQRRSHTFDKPGTFSYICTPHPFMKGTVTVASTGGGGSSGSGSGSAGRSDSGSADSSAGNQGSGAKLPASGADAGVLVALGAGLLALGLFTRRRAAG
jgi:plastocyanin